MMIIEVMLSNVLKSGLASVISALTYVSGSHFDTCTHMGQYRDAARHYKIDISKTNKAL
jgi:hypothetical protein